MTLLKPSTRSRSLRLSNRAFNLTNGILLDVESAVVDLNFAPRACAASTVRSRAEMH